MSRPRSPLRFTLVGLAAAALALAAPSAAVEPDPQVLADGAPCFDRLAAPNGTCGVLYAHVSDLLNAVPLSVQTPPDVAPDLAAGYTLTPGIEPFWPHARRSMFVAGGGVHWDENGQRPAIPMSWPGMQVHLVPGEPIHGFWYLSADTSEVGPLEVGNDSGGYGALPCLTVEMLVVDVRPEFGEGHGIAHGKTTRTVLSAEDAPSLSLPVDDPCPGSEGPLELADAHRFHVEMDRLPGSPDVLDYVTVHVIWYQHDPSGDPLTEDKIVQREWNVRTGPEFRPRIVVPIANPYQVNETLVIGGDGRVGASALLRSPWGAYEFVASGMGPTGFAYIDGGETPPIRFAVFDANGASVPVETVGDPIIRYTLGHGFDDSLLNVTYVWEPLDEPDLPPGTYTLVIEADNLQGTATARAEMTYVHAPETEREAPGPVMLAIVLISFVAVIALRERPSLRP